MLALPVYGDQPGNSQSMVDQGYGLLLDYLTMTEESFKGAIDEVLSNRKYTDKVKHFSKVYRDRPITAREEVVYWIEYVIRHKGAEHLKSPLIDMNVFEQYSLDVIGFLLIALYVFCKGVKVSWGFLLKKVCGSGKKGGKAKLN